MNETVSTTEKVRRRIERSHNQFWRPSDFSEENRYEAVLREMARMADAGDLLRIRRGLYWRGVSSEFNTSSPPGMQIAIELIGEDGIGPARASAVFDLELGTVPESGLEYIATPRRPPRDIPGLKVRWVSRAGRDERIHQHLNSKEVAFLEVLECPDLISLKGIQLDDKLKEILTGTVIRTKNLARAAKTEPAIVRQGLKNLFTAVGLEEEATKIIPVRSKNVLRKALHIS